MTVIDDIVPLSESANRQRVLAIVLKDHSSAPLILESTHEEYKSALADLRQLGLDLGASAINWATLEPMLHLLSAYSCLQRGGGAAGWIEVPLGRSIRGSTHAEAVLHLTVDSESTYQIKCKS